MVSSIPNLRIWFKNKVPKNYLGNFGGYKHLSNTITLLKNSNAEIYTLLLLFSVLELKDNF